uniref:Uncharacterized protein n=1 Tax=Moniliophthora roreri TaxID=221103 RepID=A0A0W0GD11_MONRR
MKATRLQVVPSANSDIEEAAQDDSDDIEFGEIIQPPASTCKQLHVRNELDSDFEMGEPFPAVIHS